MEMTIDQLAQRVDMSTRNIREWQRQGLIAAPARRGRVGVYDDDHVARIQRVKKLHAEGLPLNLIRRLIDTGKGPEADIRQLADQVLDPLSHGTSATLTRSELTDRLGSDAIDGLVAMGLVGDVDGDAVAVRDVATVDLISELVDVGMTVPRLAKALNAVQRHQHEIARLMIDAFRDDVWAPFVSSDFTTGDWGSIADDVARAKPGAIRLLAHLLDAAFDDVAETVVLREAAETERRLNQSK